MRMYSIGSFTLGWILAGALLPGCADSQSDESGKASGNSPAERIVPVRVEIVQARPFSETLSVTGSILAMEDVVVSTEEGGIVSEWKYPKGRVVKQGEVIVLLKDDVLRPMYEAALAQYRTSELTYQKQENVYKEQAISELQYRSAQYGRDAAKAQADLALARLERTSIKTPITGILDDHLLDVGELAPPGAPVARVVNIYYVKAQLFVPERYAGTVAVGRVVHLRVNAYPGEQFSGKVSFVGSTIIADNRSIPVEVVLKNPDGKLKPYMIAKASIELSSARAAITIDESLVQQIDQQTQVVYVEREEKARRQVVTLGGRNGGKVEILSGLSIGDRLIVSGYQNVVDGQLIEVTQ